MTKHVDPGTPASDRPALEIEITEGMIEAGAYRLSWFDPEGDLLDGGRLLVAEIFEVMLEAQGYPKFAE